MDFDSSSKNLAGDDGELMQEKRNNMAQSVMVKLFKKNGCEIILFMENQSQKIIQRAVHRKDFLVPERQNIATQSTQGLKEEGVIKQDKGFLRIA